MQAPSNHTVDTTEALTKGQQKLVLIICYIFEIAFVSGEVQSGPNLPTFYHG